MKEKILNNLGLKLLALVLATFLWGIIVNITDPAKDRTITGVTVHMINEDSLTDKGYTYDILDGSKITVVVKGPTSLIKDITASDIYATADFSTLSPISDYVNIETTCIKSGVDDSKIEIVMKTSQVKINIENRETRNFDVEIALLGNPAPGYAVGDCDVSPMSVKITGSESIIESIERVVAEYDIEGASLDIAESVQLKLYDADDNRIDDSTLVFSRQEVRVKIPILLRKTIPVSYATYGAVDENYVITSITHSVDEIEIAGTSTNIAAVSEIVIPADLIDVTGLKESKEYTIKIGQYVPANVKILSTATSTVTVNVEPLNEQEFNFMTSRITIENQDKNVECEIEEDLLSVTYKGIKANLEKLANNRISATINLEGLDSGEYRVLVEFAEIEDCVPVGEQYVTVNINRVDNAE
jgi:YbbR domain-containing protein